MGHALVIQTRKPWISFPASEWASLGRTSNVQILFENGSEKL